MATNVALKAQEQGECLKGKCHISCITCHEMIHSYLFSANLLSPLYLISGFMADAVILEAPFTSIGEVVVNFPVTKVRPWLHATNMA